MLEIKDLTYVLYDLVQDPGARQQEPYTNYQQILINSKAIIIPSLGYKALTVVQSASYPSEMFKTLNDRYSSCTTKNKVIVMTSLTVTLYENNKDIGEYLSKMNNMFNKLAAMDSLIDSDLQVAILLV